MSKNIVVIGPHPESGKIMVMAYGAERQENATIRWEFRCAWRIGDDTAESVSGFRDKYFPDTDAGREAKAAEVAKALRTSVMPFSTVLHDAPEGSAPHPDCDECGGDGYVIVGECSCGRDCCGHETAACPKCLW